MKSRRNLAWDKEERKGDGAWLGKETIDHMPRLLNPGPLYKLHSRGVSVKDRGKGPGKEEVRIPFSRKLKAFLFSKHRILGCL